MSPRAFGEGFAPFFIALATFVGALISWLLLRALPTRALAAGANGLRSVLTGLLPALAIGLGQVVIMMAVLLWGLDMKPVYPVAMAAFIYLTTVAFLALQQMFIIILGTATGRVVSLVLLMLQLSSSGGTYPVETTPGFFQALHPFMPATYVVSGLRELMTGGIDSRLWISVAFLAVLALGFGGHQLVQCRPPARLLHQAPASRTGNVGTCAGPRCRPAPAPTKLRNPQCHASPPPNRPFWLPPWNWVRCTGFPAPPWMKWPSGQGWPRAVCTTTFPPRTSLFEELLTAGVSSLAATLRSARPAGRRLWRH